MIRPLGSANSGGGAGLTATRILPSGVAAGEDIFVTYAGNGAATSVVDSKGNVYSRKIQQTGTRYFELWHSRCTTPLVAADTITVTGPNRTNMGAFVMDDADMAAFDADLFASAYVSGTTSGTPTNWNGGAITPDTPSLVLQAIAISAGRSNTPASGWTEVMDTNAGSFGGHANARYAGAGAAINENSGVMSSFGDAASWTSIVIPCRADLDPDHAPLTQHASVKTPVAGASVTVPRPRHRPGDVLLGLVVTDDDGDPSAIDVAAGWTEHSQSGVGGIRLGLLTKEASASEPVGQDFTGDATRIGGIVVPLWMADADDPVVDYSLQTFGAGANIASPSVESAEAGRVIYAVATTAPAAVALDSVPAGLRLIAAIKNTDAAPFLALAVFESYLAAPGEVASALFVASGGAPSNSVAGVFVIREPASAPSGGGGDGGGSQHIGRGGIWNP